MSKPQDSLRRCKTNVPQLQPAHGYRELCSYDLEPKRRGPDRQPGTRQRSTTAVASDRPRRRRRKNLDSSSTATRKKTEAQVQNTGDAVNQTLSAVFDDISGITAVPHTGLAIINEELFPLYDDGHEGVPVIPYNVSAQFQQAQPLGSVNNLQVPNIGYDADDLELSLMSKLTAFSAISCPLIIGNNRLDEELDERIEEANVIGAEPGLQFTRETWWDALLTQYALIHDGTSSLTVGLLATFFQSSESELGLHGRVRALALQEQAQSALEASLNAGWIDCGLVQASLLLGFFEMSPHSLQSKERTRSALVMLDALVHSLRLTTLDADDPRVSVFPPPARAHCACFVPRAGDAGGPVELVRSKLAARMQLLVVQYGVRMS
ncbi:hypothetical protein A0H81_09167 [Grifola frondosa]|uniref:Uncharacterized protein n=1 Tax=Grifola frondosa TaxID=5627 RepID=A0A1C7M0Q2_GRIFR|nr:hypothetical protein A0H81_09167 [Grifola frondosa]